MLFHNLLDRVGPLSEAVENSISVVFQTDINSGNNFTTYTSGLYPMVRYCVLISNQYDLSLSLSLPLFSQEFMKMMFLSR